MLHIEYSGSSRFFSLVFSPQDLYYRREKKQKKIKQIITTIITRAIAFDRLSMRTVTTPDEAAVSSTVWINSSNISRAPSAVSSTASWAWVAYQYNTKIAHPIFYVSIFISLAFTVVIYSSLLSTMLAYNASNSATYNSNNTINNNNNKTNSNKVTGLWPSYDEQPYAAMVCHLMVSTRVIHRYL